jgi:hypothetical protein
VQQYRDESVAIQLTLVSLFDKHIGLVYEDRFPTRGVSKDIRQVRLGFLVTNADLYNGDGKNWSSSGECDRLRCEGLAYTWWAMQQNDKSLSFTFNDVKCFGVDAVSCLFQHPLTRGFVVLHVRH